MTHRRLIWLPGDPPDNEPERTSPLVDLWAAECDAVKRHAERYRAMSDAYEGEMSEFWELKPLTPAEMERKLAEHNGYETYESPEPPLRSEDE